MPIYHQSFLLSLHVTICVSLTWKSEKVKQNVQVSFGSTYSYACNRSAYIVTIVHLATRYYRRHAGGLDDIYVERVEMYCAANEIDDAARKRAILLSVLIAAQQPIDSFAT